MSVFKTDVDNFFGNYHQYPFLNLFDPKMCEMFICLIYVDPNMAQEPTSVPIQLKFAQNLYFRH